MENNLGQQKPYKLEFDYREKYLFAFVKGPQDSLEISMMFWQEILEEAKGKGYSKLLVTEDFEGSVTIGDIFFLVDGISKMGYDSMRIAFVDKKTEQYDVNKFGETVANNRGISGKVCISEDEAEEWLLEGSS